MEIFNAHLSYARPKNRWRQRKVRVYFWPEGESIWDNIQNRHSRPYEVFRPLIQDVVNAQLKEADGKIYSFTDTAVGKARQIRAHWSQKAGCSCGCSPAFILDNVFGNYDIHLDYRMEATA